MSVVLPPMAMWAAYFAMGCCAVGFGIAAVGLLMAIPRIGSGGGTTYGERAYRANQRVGDFYTKPEFKRERRLVLVGVGIFLASLAFMVVLMVAFGERVADLG